MSRNKMQFEKYMYGKVLEKLEERKKCKKVEKGITGFADGTNRGVAGLEGHDSTGQATKKTIL